MRGYKYKNFSMSIYDAIARLDLLQHPVEPWEREPDDDTCEALEMAKEALEDIERIRKWMKGELSK